MLVMAFDLLYAGEESLVRRPYRERRERLEDLITPGTHWQVSAVFDDAKAVLDATRQLGLEGIVCKRPDAPYRPGRRSPAWRKIKNSQVADGHRRLEAYGPWRPPSGQIAARPAQQCRAADICRHRQDRLH
ncbi:hypothetical protein [Nonomuraea sp. NPDC049480]|uniref:ATP-dependent DNA ligase n=1 Tax=Nonomuraea sp. NPDC049480 TaxID=3364353 RepID=UPI003793F798